ncbi:MAG: polyphosphate polymerase domain-containing protein [Saprospiraceae bacterium]|nr:polyphosphate polymerase domain-containing protein [Lewinella sp.]
MTSDTKSQYIFPTLQAMRYERKFPSRHLSMSSMEQLILRHPLGFRKAFPDRQINNVYFDTPDWATLRENLSGISDRTKYRLRWYGSGQTQLIGPARFELKKKENLLGTKIIYSLDEQIAWPDISSLTANLPSLRHNMLQPSLVNSYRRAYFQSADLHFRLTLDWDLRFAPYHIQPFPLCPFPEPVLVIELKYEQAVDDRLDDFTQFWPLRLDRFSKYVNGMQMVYL